MARAARTASVIVVLLGALALLPSTAAAGVAGTTSVTMPPLVFVGETGLTATIRLTNVNTPPADESNNTVCNESDPAPCTGSGIELLPACGALSGIDMCNPTMQDPGAFEFDATATGTAGTACGGTAFDVTVPDPLTGRLLITPTSGNVTLPSPTLGPPPTFCDIELEFSVLRMPTGDSSEGPGTQVIQIASARQHDGMTASSSAGTSETRVKTQPAISTTASPGVALGGSVTDTATVSGLVNPSGEGTVTFTLFGPDDPPCQPPEAFTSTVPLNIDGTATSEPFTPTRVGTYRWLASYSGDENNAPVSGGCDDPGETVVVSAVVAPPPPPPPPPATPTIAILASPGIVLGGLISAGATLAGRVNPLPGATILFRLFGPDDVGCGGTPVFAAVVAVSEPGGALSPPFAPGVQSGVYRWVATYSGDANNAGVSTPCNGPGSTVVVEPRPAGVISSGFASQPRVGATSVLSIAGLDPLRPVAGVQVEFGEPRALQGISACRLGNFGISVSPVRLDVPYVFLRPGRHTITIIVLSGSCGGELTRTVSRIEVFVAAGQGSRTAFAAREPTARAAQSCVQEQVPATEDRRQPGEGRDRDPLPRQRRAPQEGPEEPQALAGPWPVRRAPLQGHAQAPLLRALGSRRAVAAVTAAQGPLPRRWCRREHRLRLAVQREARHAGVDEQPAAQGEHPLGAL